MAEYWIVDPQTKRIEQYVLKDETYQLQAKTDSGVIRSVAIKQFLLPVHAVFDKAETLAALQTILSSDN